MSAVQSDGHPWLRECEGSSRRINRSVSRRFLRRGGCLRELCVVPTDVGRKGIVEVFNTSKTGPENPGEKTRASSGGQAQGKYTSAKFDLTPSELVAVEAGAIW